MTGTQKETQNIVLGTRGSALALWQAKHVREVLRAAHPAKDVEIVEITTSGDSDTRSSVGSIGVGVFTKQIEVELENRKIDIAVHSLKDLPSEIPAGLTIGAFLRREDPRDVIVGGAPNLDSLPSDPVVLTGSPRRKALVLSERPDARVEGIRGNVPTRLARFSESGADALILAAAGLNRLGLANTISGYLNPDVFVPAAGQGIVAVECREDDTPMIAMLGSVSDLVSAAMASAERSFMAAIGAGCQTPVGAHARVDATDLLLHGVILSGDGSETIRQTAKGTAERPAELGEELARLLIDAGANKLLAREQS